MIPRGTRKSFYVIGRIRSDKKKKKMNHFGDLKIFDLTLLNGVAKNVPTAHNHTHTYLVIVIVFLRLFQNN